MIKYSIIILMLFLVSCSSTPKSGIKDDYIIAIREKDGRDININAINAEVYLNDEFIGNCDGRGCYKIKLKDDKYTVRIEAKGYKSLEKQITIINGGGLKPIFLELEPTEETELKLEYIKTVKDPDRKIELYEGYLKKNPDVFVWDIHHELSGLYGAKNNSKFKYHKNIIFKNAIMDGYSLECLTGWYIKDKKWDKALIYLKRYISDSKYKYLKAVCMIAIGDIYSKHKDNPKEARTYYKKIADSKDKDNKEYIALAKARLEKLSK